MGAHHPTTTKRARNVARDVPLHRLLALQERAIGTITVDTGPAHSAGALGCPLTVLIGYSRAGRKFRDRLDC